MWVNIIRADRPSLNNNVYPEATLRAAAILPVCHVYPNYGRPADGGGFAHSEPQIAQTLGYRFEDGWLQANVHFFCPHFAQMVKDGHSVMRAAAEVITDSDDCCIRRLVLVINKIDHLALCSPRDASWCVTASADAPCCPEVRHVHQEPPKVTNQCPALSIRSPSPVSTSTPI